MTLFTLPYDTILDANGDPISGAKVNFYEAGTSTPLDTYSDEDLSSANANPVVADSSGRVGPVYLKPQPYKVVTTDASDNVISTVDNYRPVASGEQILYASTVGGTANAIALTLDPAIIALRDGMRVWWKVAATNTAAATLNINVLGAKSIVWPDDTAISGGDLVLGAMAEGIYSSATDKFHISIGVTAPSARMIGTGAVAPALDDTTKIWDTSASAEAEATVAAVLDLLGTSKIIAGLALSNNGTDAAHDIDIASGMASDDTDASFIRLTSSITKQIDATWAVGTDQGGLDTGTVANSTWYYVWLIKRSDTGVVDVLFSTSASSPTMPTDYDLKRRIGGVITDGSANIVSDRFVFILSGDVERFESELVTLPVAAAAITISHGLSGTPKEGSVKLRCTTGNLGWSIGQEVDVTYQSVSGTVSGFMDGYDSTEMLLQAAANALTILNTSGTLQAITASSWRAVARATYY